MGRCRASPHHVSATAVEDRVAVGQLQVLRRCKHFKSNKFLLHVQIRITQVLNILKKESEFSELMQWSTKGMCATLSVLQHHLWSLPISVRSLPLHKVPAIHVACLVYSASVAPPHTSHFIGCYKWFKCALQTSDPPTYPNVFRQMKTTSAFQPSPTVILFS